MKRAAGTRKVGHTGTLDPFATGLLIALVGSATRCARYFNGLSKRYLTTIRFGTATDTDDATGAVVREAELPTEAAIGAALGGFYGTLEQLPPAYSAVHVNGRRAHEIARSGETPDVRPRSVTVYRLDLRDLVVRDGLVAEASLDIECSAGTYIRSIARDLGAALASAAHAATLRRTAIGAFGLDRARPIDDLSLPDDLCDLASVLRELPGLELVEVDAGDAHRVRNGRRIPVSELDLPEGPGRYVFVHDGRAIAVGRAEHGTVAYDLVLPAEAGA